MLNSEEKRLKKREYMREYTRKNNVRINEQRRILRITDGNIEQRRAKERDRSFQYRSQNQEKVRAYVLRKSKEYRDRYRPKINAVKAVGRATASGKLVKPKECSKCGAISRRIEAHHYLGYEKAHHLDIQWLCVLCHSRVHHP